MEGNFIFCTVDFQRGQIQLILVLANLVSVRSCVAKAILARPSRVNGLGVLRFRGGQSASWVTMRRLRLQFALLASEHLKHKCRAYAREFQRR